MNARTVKTYYIAMAIFWMVFGLITTFYPRLMDLFQTPEGIAAKTEYSNHVWLHDGTDILAFCVLLFALSAIPPNRTMLRATAVAAMGPPIAIAYSVFAAPYSSMLLLGPGLCCFAFGVWGWVLSGRVQTQS